DSDIIFHKKFLPFHANGMVFEATVSSGKKIKGTYYSIGGGFVVKKERINANRNLKAFHSFPFPVEKGKELLDYCKQRNCCISELVLQNERSLRNDTEIDMELHRIWETMLESMYLGCHTEGTLPGGLNVHRRAYDMHLQLMRKSSYSTPWEW